MAKKEALVKVEAVAVLPHLAIVKALRIVRKVGALSRLATAEALRKVKAVMVLGLIRLVVPKAQTEEKVAKKKMVREINDFIPKRNKT